jgi:hypothetical protein
VLGRLSAQTDLVIGTSTGNRGHRELEGLIGLAQVDPEEMAKLLALLGDSAVA